MCLWARPMPMWWSRLLWRMCDGACFVDAVVADSEVDVGAVVFGGCFGETLVGSGWGCASEGSVGPVVVVVTGEFVEEALELVEAVGAGLGGEVFLEGLLETFDFSAGGGGGWVWSSSVRCLGPRGGLRRRCGLLSRRRSGWCRPWRCR